MKNVTAILISFLRPEYTMACLKSLKQIAPEIEIIVAENGEFDQELNDFILNLGGQYVQMPYDSGVCHARNEMMKLVKTEYVLVGDDDFFYLEDTGIEKMLKFLENRQDIDLIGGRIFENGQVLDYQGYMNMIGDHLEYRRLDIESCEFDEATGLKYKICDIVFNFFIARKDRIINYPWDEKIKVAFEHSDWFLSLKNTGIKVAFTPDCVVVHKPRHVKLKNQKKYMQFRMRRTDMSYFFEKHKIKYSIGFKGIKMKADPMNLTKLRFYAKVGISHEGKTYNPGDIIMTDNPNDNMAPYW